MFDRCDADTLAVLETGFAEAKRLGHSWLGTEHLLLALVQHSERLPEPVARLLPTEEQVRAALNAEFDQRPGPDAELLATLGIDLDEVRAAVRRTFGPEALDRLAERRVHQPWQPWRRPSRDCFSLLAAQGLSVLCRVKRALEHALEDATRRQRSEIDPAGLLLGMVEVEDALANRLLRDTGVAPAAVRAALQQSSP